jgi:hypothetical protein
MIEIKLRARLEPPEKWVPELAVVLNRYREDKVANEAVVMSLIDMGLLRLVAPADRPDQIAVDSRPLQALLAEYGPRVTTATGEPGVAASRGTIWTPGGSTGGGGIWTPGSAAAPAPGAGSAGAEKPKLIIPGR